MEKTTNPLSEDIAAAVRVRMREWDNVGCITQVRFA